MGFRSQHTKPRGKPRQIPRGDNRVPEVQDLADFLPNIPDLEVSPRQIRRGDNRVPEGQVVANFLPKVLSLITPATHQAKIYPRILIGDLQLPLVQCLKIFGVYLNILIVGCTIILNIFIIVIIGCPI